LVYPRVAFHLLVMNCRFLFSLIVAASGLSATSSAKPLVVQTSVSSRVSPEYQRKTLPNGLPEKQLYAISNGGLAPGTMLDSSVEKVRFPAIAGIVAEHLGRQNYFLAPDSKSAQLLLVIQWGRTIPHNGLNYASAVNNVSSAMSNMRVRVPEPTGTNSMGTVATSSPNLIGEDTSVVDGALMMLDMETRMRYRSNEQNARLLGYVDAINDADGIARFAGAGDTFRELFEDLEDSRYYVLVKAYEFRAAVEKRESKLLWITRISVATRGLDFDESLRPMLARATPYFGRPTKRLIRDFKGAVELGESSVIEADAAMPKSDKPRGSDSKENRN
jgi:hypothetical protein